MWTMSDYNSLKTFQQVIDEQGKEAVFAGTTVDSATQDAIIAWFKNRKVSDNENFLLYFRRLLSLHETQYTSLLRVQTIQFDPLVTQYMERLIDREGQNSSTNTRNGTTNTSDSGTSTASGTNTVNTTSTSTSHGTSDTTGKNSGKQDGTSNGTTNDKSMNAQLPQSSTGAGAGIPENMNWNYATEQNESKGKNTNTSSQTNSGTSETNSTSDSRASGDSETNGRDNRTVTDSRNGNTTTTENGGTNGTNSEVVKERSTGRMGDAPELLKKAVYYISTTNAFVWFVDKLEPAFMGVYE